VAVAFAQIDVMAAGLGYHGAHLGVGQRAKEHQHTARDPNINASIRGAEGSAWATSRGARKMPAPMTMPSTIAAESINPRVRGKLGHWC